MGVIKRMTKNGPVYQVHYTHDGKQYFEPRLEDEQAAKRLDAQRQREIRGGSSSVSHIDRAQAIASKDEA